MNIVDLLYAEPSLSERAAIQERRELAPPPPVRALPALERAPTLNRAAVALFGRVSVAMPAGKPRIVQLVGPRDGAAPAALIDALAVVAAAEAGRRVLLVDASADLPPDAPQARTLAAVMASGGDPRCAIVADPAVCGLSHAPLCDGVDALTRLGTTALRLVFETLAGSYDTILIDAGVFTETGAAACVCPVAAGTVLVVRAGADRAPAVHATIAGLGRAGATVIGTVLQAGVSVPAARFR